jgi:hypothetical protein
LPSLLYRLIYEHELTVNDIYGHYEFNGKKTCPNIDMVSYRDFLEFVYINNFKEDSI